ncbi:bacteriohemerythrin [Trichlorobacter lovleyi]|uniref:Hemerythrin-like metal-binding protein n=1 Tax=Trichlorobacter lovleyi (strain ATCC BAA-1151 / DSM 17278 / SZ) TaxID=398767 RepID=B3E2N3_TRIL1|nr:hemerythrin family protein [Trichlorobacter lovleyi]ACD95690.1 hemerythrin-like metal-binding protein [Trichlorobacter lovleyi SZ]
MGIYWRKELEIGVIEIDKQHQSLVESFNAFLLACRNGKGSSELLELLKFLDEYALHHFHTEEAIQKAAAYPEYESHRLQHLGFTKKIKDLKEQLTLNEPPQINHLIATNTVLLDWFIKHISGSDSHFGRHLVETCYFADSGSQQSDP